MNKFLNFTLITVTLLGILVWYLLTHVAPYMIISPQRLSEPIDLNDYSLNWDHVKITTNDSIKLQGYHVKAKGIKKATIILIHGIGGCKEHMVGLSANLSKQGYESILFDLRAHGKSGGQFCTYGFYEKGDISKIVDYVEEKQLAGPDSIPIGVWGNSLGGAVALQTLAIDQRIQFGIIESTFTELDQIVIDYQKRFMGGFGIKALTDYSLEQAAKIAAFDPEKVKPIESVKNIKQPVLITHGSADQNISVDYGKALYESLASPEKELIIVEGGEHWGLFETGGKAYKERLFKFIEKQVIHKH